MRDEGFNRLNLSCAVILYHIDDVGRFLAEFEYVTNQLGCIVRCFQGIEFLRVMYCVGALIGLHLVELLFLSLTAAVPVATSTTYSKLIPAFQQLCTDLSGTDVEKLLILDKPAFSFISESLFQQTYDRADITNV